MDVEIKRVEGVWNADPKDPLFNGHFPGRPILPAVATVEHAFVCLKQMLDAPQLKLVEVKSAKFASPITPNTKVKTMASELKRNEWQIALTEAESCRELAELHFIVC